MFPVLFISHGAPTLALDPGAIGQAWHSLASSLPRPEAVLVVSAHWQENQLRLTSAAHPHTIHDFYGFPQALYRMNYPAPGAPELAHELSKDLAAETDSERGLDHGVWIPLMQMYPNADVPVLALSLPSSPDPVQTYTLGQMLRRWRSRLLIIGSGGLTHNLRLFGRADIDALPFEPTQRFRLWMHQQLQQGNHSKLLDYQQAAPDVAMNHPSNEHLLPLFVCLGASHVQGAQIIDLGVQYGMLAMDTVVFS